MSEPGVISQRKRIRPVSGNNRDDGGQKALPCRFYRMVTPRYNKGEDPQETTGGFLPFERDYGSIEANILGN
ncbi:hypothetical protein GCM10007416_07510 [Kroppenstedtia guangzhouensis]|jgi:hypothetical protein|uniref:Uncharacterized protein n=1 Tax=Kroppenstedtia guangzhouensis TaxID=1274356 RepID=A0ABQ1G594_9BACL|nr:hypothetical protein GCM10007416_07510 [Kroppenstedtia guangzhouensis]